MHDKKFEKFEKLFDSIGKFTRTEKFKAVNEANMKKLLNDIVFIQSTILNY